MIVDSPGFGEHGKRSGQVERYLAKSFGAIYLVNTASAGGVNSGRVRFIIFLYMCTLFHIFHNFLFKLPQSFSYIHVYQRKPYFLVIFLQTTMDKRQHSGELYQLI